MYYAGIDVGATNIRVVIGDETIDILESTRTKTPPGPAGTDVATEVVEAIRSACETVDIDAASIRAVGIGAAGHFDMDAGSVIHLANLPGSVGEIPLAERVSEAIESGDVFLRKDTAMAVIGERAFSTTATDDLVYLTISSGIGAGVAIDGNVLSGRNGNVGEVGHMTLDPREEMICGCGLGGHWEAYCSGKNIPRYAERLHEEGEFETALPLREPEFSASDVFDLAEEDAFAAHVIDKLGHWNVLGVANLIQAYAPSAIRIGGGVALNNPDYIIDPIRDEIGAELIVDVPEIGPSILGHMAVVKGALVTAISEGRSNQ